MHRENSQQDFQRVKERGFSPGGIVPQSQTRGAAALTPERQHAATNEEENGIGKLGGIISRAIAGRLGDRAPEKHKIFSGTENSIDLNC